MNKYINFIIERFKKIDWMLILFLGAFTFSVVLCFVVDYQITKDVFFIIGIFASYIFVILASDEAKKEYAKENLNKKGEGK